MALASIIISTCALLFTTTSFWWLQARRGHLTCYPVQNFSGYLYRNKAALRIPLSIFNSGAVPLVVTDLRLRLASEVGDEALMHFRTLRRSLRTDADDVEDFAHAYSVTGRSVDTRMVEFAMNTSPVPLLHGHPVTATVEAQVDHRQTWVKLGSFPLNVQTMASPSNYITYSNQEHVWPEGIVADAAVEHRKLRQQLGLPTPTTD
ncbi:hypothetical protein O2V63_02625 [Modestobacter sp. VKM Ac-2977]|uniref:hypothetical protein n=1 Tax=Modestobacter sp. VKM Ac-2977 TaxID=3004131 RepID=UPI0022AA7692|nr:hypothetical protein [Modestobacter sp. VKM Ac-2977]MCZ2819220.1 hypothetical protein [Modestobacter sp. VKM Ac-2977]